MTVDPEAWAYASGCDPQHVAGNIADYLESEILELELVREAPITGLVVKAANVTPPPIPRKAQTETEGSPAA